MREEEKKTNQSWGGRFKKPLSDEAAAFGESQSFDRKLYREDIAGSKAHAAMLGRQGIITSEEAALIRAGLDRIQAEIEAGEFVWKPELEDIHMNIEARLVEIIGPAGKKLHTGRSRNDQIGLDFRLHVAARCENWKQLLRKLIETILDLAGRSQDVIMPGFTHLQPAQPIFAAQHILAYAGMFRRDWERIEKALPSIRTSPLGAGALAGSTYPLDPQGVADEVGFGKIYANSMDAVSDRDFVLEALFIGSVIMMHVSRLCEELIIWANPAFGFITLPDEFSTGSSIMPQKKNPDMAELARGKTGRTYGNLMALLTTMKGLPLAYNKDMQEDKEAFFDTDATVSPTLKVITAMLELIAFNPQKMKAACKTGFLNATDLADYLAGKNIPFRDAHRLTGLAVARAEELGIGLEELNISEFKKIAPQIEEDIYPLLDYEACAARRETPGGTGRMAVQKQLADWHDWLRGN